MRIPALLCGLLLLAACTQPAPEQAVPVAAAHTAAELAGNMLDTMGGREALEAVQSIVQKGGGTRRHFGQIPARGAEDPPGQLSELTETIDLANQRAAFDNMVRIGEEFSQHRTEVYTRYKDRPLGWSTTNLRPNQVTSVNGLFSWATHDTPTMLLRRNAVTIALAALDVDAAVAEATIDGASYWHLTTQLKGERVGLYIDKASLQLKAYRVVDTERMRGDTNALYVLGDWRPVGDVVLPHALEIRKDDDVYASLHYDSITVNDADLRIFDVPNDVKEQAEAVIAANGAAWVPLEWNPIAEHVTHVVAFSHHSMVVEFPSFVVVVEGPYTEAQSLTLARLIEEHIGKPIRYVVPTHPHYDHTGGIRALVALGANVLVAAGHEAELRMIVDAPHTNPPDVLAANREAGVEVGHIEMFSGMTEITEEGQTLQLFEARGIPHVAPKTLAFVPSTGVLFQSDLFFGAPGPDAAALHEAIKRYGLAVQQIAGGHGGVLPYSSLEDAMAPAPVAAPPMP